MVQSLELIAVESADRLSHHVQVSVQEVVVGQFVAQHIRLVVDGTVDHFVDHLTNLRVDTPYEASLAATDVSLVDGREREREFYTLVVQCSGIHHILCDTVDL